MMQRPYLMTVLLSAASEHFKHDDYTIVVQLDLVLLKSFPRCR